MAMFTMATSAWAAPIPLDTGVAPWFVNTGGPSVAVTNITSVPGAWLPAVNPRQWVGTAADSNAAPGTYTFTLDIGTYVNDAGGGTFTLSYAADNSVTWTISNGSLGGTDICNTGLPSNCFQASAGAPRALTGSFASNSVLTATVVNNPSGSNPMGLLVEGTAVGASEVPEPSTYAMITIGALAVALSRYRRA